MNKNLMKASNLGKSGSLESTFDGFLDLREGKNKLVSTNIRMNRSRIFKARYEQCCKLNVNQRSPPSADNIISKFPCHFIIPRLCAIPLKGIVVALTQNADYKVHHENIAEYRGKHKKCARPRIRKECWALVSDNERSKHLNVPGPINSWFWTDVNDGPEMREFID